ncbi:MAG: IS200/IS605 family transposase [Terriglobales bacterium]
MSHAYARNYIHLIFGTKDRRPRIKPAFEPKLYAYLRGIAREYLIDVLEIGGGEEHVHMLLNLPPKVSLATAVRVLKANSSKWMNENGHLFAWQQGYAALSVSVSNLDSVIEYIRRQPEHHKKRDFASEYTAFLRKHGIEFTPEHVFG